MLAFFNSPARDCSRCSLASLCLSKGSVKSSGDQRGAPGQRERWSDEDKRLYQRHRWRSEGFRDEAKTWHRLARALRRGLQNMRIQAFLTAAAINLKRPAAAVCALSWSILNLLFGLRRLLKSELRPNARI